MQVITTRSTITTRFGFLLTPHLRRLTSEDSSNVLALLSTKTNHN